MQRWFGQNILPWRSIIGCLGGNSPVVKFFCNVWQKLLFDETMCIKWARKIFFKIDREWISSIFNCLHNKRKWIPDHFACKVAVVVWWYWWFFREIGNIYTRCGSQARTRHTDNSKQGTSFREEICDGLLRLHAFMGCDSASAFGGEVNWSAFKLIIKDMSHLKAKA